MIEAVYCFLLGVGVTVVIMLVVFCWMVKDVGPCEHEKYSGRVLREYPEYYHPDVSHFTSVDEKED